MNSWQWLGASLLAALLACAPEAGTGITPDDAATAESDRAISTTERAYEVRYGGQLIGRSNIRQQIRADGSRELETEMSFTLIREVGGEEDEFHSETRARSRYGPDLRWIEDESIDTEAGVETIERARIHHSDPPMLIVEYDGAGFSDVQRYPLPDDFDDSLAVFDRLRKRYQRTGEPAKETFSTFASSRRRFEAETMTIEGRERIEHGGQSHQAWRVRSVDASESVTIALVDDDFLPFHIDIDGEFEIAWVDRAPASDEIRGARISSVLAVEGPVIRDWRNIESMDLRLTVTGDDPERRPVFADSHYHRVERGASGEVYDLQLRSTRLPADHRAPSAPIATLPNDARRFLDATPQSQSDHPEIKKLAAKIAGSNTDSLDITRRIVLWTYDELDKEAGARGSATATETLEEGKGDCTEHAVLVVALARARGIPARQVDGIVLLPGADGSLLAGYHAWAEVWVGRWIAVDATVGEVGTSARYLAFGYNEPGEPETASALVRTLGKTRIVVKDHSLFPRGR